MENIPSVEILGVRVARLSASQALGEIERLGSREGASLIAYANAHTLNLAYRDPSYRELLRSANLVLNDGSGVAFAARLKGERFPENLNGSDFNPRILELCARERWPVYFMGGRPGVAERAADALRERIPGLEIVGTHVGYLSGSEDVVSEIRSYGARVVMVAMGNPLQERWLAGNLATTGASLGVGVGAFFDFSAGEVPRAPASMSRLGVEWIYRLVREPARLWRRYLVGNPLFLSRVARERMRGGFSG